MLEIERTYTCLRERHGQRLNIILLFFGVNDYIRGDVTPTTCTCRMCRENRQKSCTCCFFKCHKLSTRLSHLCSLQVDRASDLAFEHLGTWRRLESVGMGEILQLIWSKCVPLEFGITILCESGFHLIIPIESRTLNKNTKLKYYSLLLFVWLLIKDIF